MHPKVPTAIAAETHLVPVEAEDSNRHRTVLRSRDCGIAQWHLAVHNSPERSSPPSPPSFSRCFCISHTHTPILCAVRKRGSDNRKSEAHPEVPKNFLALILLTEAVWFWGGGTG